MSFRAVLPDNQRPMDDITPHRHLITIPREIVRLIVIRTIPFTVVTYINDQTFKPCFFFRGEGCYESADDY